MDLVTRLNSSLFQHPFLTITWTQMPCNSVPFWWRHCKLGCLYLGASVHVDASFYCKLSLYGVKSRLSVIPLHLWMNIVHRLSYWEQTTVNSYLLYYLYMADIALILVQTSHARRLHILCYFMVKISACKDPVLHIKFHGHIIMKLRTCSFQARCKLASGMLYAFLTFSFANLLCLMFTLPLSHPHTPQHTPSHPTHTLTPPHTPSHPHTPSPTHTKTAF